MDTQLGPEQKIQNELQPDKVWTQISAIVRQQVDAPMLWLAMQSAKPIIIDGNYFVAGLPKSMEYLAINLQNSEAETAIEEALKENTGRVLAFRLIEGETAEEWYLTKVKEHVPAQPAYILDLQVEEDQFDTVEKHPVEPASKAILPSASAHVAHSDDFNEVATSWSRLNELLVMKFKSGHHMRYPHGQARFLLEAVHMMSDTMDILMPGGDQPRDEAQERSLAKAIERLGIIITLDPIFVSLELFRYRISQGKHV